MMTGTMMNVLPVIPKIVDIFDPLDEPRAALDLVQGEFFVNRDEHLAPLILWDYALTESAAFITAAIDAMYITTTEHCCALSAIIK